MANGAGTPSTALPRGSMVTNTFDHHKRGHDEWDSSQDALSTRGGDDG